MAIVAELTGYPPELLDLDLDLEADLGVDTVKQAEVFAAVRERFGVERDDTSVAAGLPDPDPRDRLGPREDRAASTGRRPSRDGGRRGRRPSTSRRCPCTPHGQRRPRRGRPAAAAGARARAASGPRPVRPHRCRPGDGARVVVMRDEGGVADALLKRLAKAGVDTLALDPGTPTDQLLEQVDAGAPTARSTGVYWLAALDDEGPHGALDLAGWREALRRRVKALYATMRRLYDDSPFLVTGTRLGGFHGYDEAGATAPMGGAVTGFAKAYKRERPTRWSRRSTCRQPQDRRRGRAARRRDAARPRLRRGRARRRAALGRRARRASRSRPRTRPTTARCARARTASSSSPARPAASSRRSPPTWPRPPAAPSTCST